MNERLNEIRKILKLSQEEMGKRLGIQKSSVSRLEAGINNITDTMIKLICTEFNVNEAWLRTGEGDPFVTTPDDELERLAVKYNLSDLAKRVVGEFVKLDKAQSDAVLEWLKNVFTNTKANDKKTVTHNKQIQLAAAHNDNLEDPEEQEKVKRDLDRL